MKCFKYISLVGVVFLSSCSNNNDAIEDHVTNDVTIKLTIQDQAFVNVDDGTRLALNDEEETLTSSKFTRYYEEGDEFGIVPESGDTPIKFVVPETTTGNTSVTSGAWNVKADNSYACYYPYSIQNQDGTALPFIFTGQNQTDNKNTDHLKDVLFYASTPVTSSDGNFNFILSDMGTVVKFILTLPSLDNATNFTKMTVDAGEDNSIFVNAGTLNLFDDAQTFTTTSSSSVYTLLLNDVSLSTGGSSEPLVLYALFGNGLNSKNIPLTITLYDNRGSIYTANKTLGVNLLRSRNYYMSLTMSDPVENNELGTLTGKVN